jgi:hypothetical protein
MDAPVISLGTTTFTLILSTAAFIIERFSFQLFSSGNVASLSVLDGSSWFFKNKNGDQSVITGVPSEC